MFRILTSIIILILVTTLRSYATEGNLAIATIYFRTGKTNIDRFFLGNQSSLDKLDAIFYDMESGNVIDSVLIIVSASPEGSRKFNEHLIRQRVNAVNRLLVDKYSWLNKERVIISHNIFSWQQIATLITQDFQAPNHTVIMEILELNISEAAKEKLLKNIDHGETYNYILTNYLKEMRNATISIAFKEEISAKTSGTVPIMTANPTDEIIVSPDSETVDVILNTDSITPDLSPLSLTTESSQTVEMTTRADEEPLLPHWAIKTNGLYCILGAFNIVGEYYYSNNYSANMAVIYSPYTLHHNYKFRLLTIEPEARYWLNRHSIGHVVGVYGQVGYYNVACNSDWRYQDKDGNTPAFGVGISYGYSLAIAKKWRLEFNIGFGYTHFQYDIFYNIPNGAIYQSDFKNYWGVNKVGICLSYVFNRKIR